MALLRARLVALAVFLAAPVAVAGPPPKAPRAQQVQNQKETRQSRSKTAKLEAPARRSSPGRSIGSPTDGRLIGGARLADAPYIRIVPVYAAGDARWGLEPLVKLIDDAARAVRKQFPGSILSVGHLSRPGGGNIERHASHESGRDADIGFYIKDYRGKLVYADHFVSFKGDGTAPSWPGAYFDDARNWAFVASVASSTRARVTHIFVATPLRQRLLRYAEKIGAPAAVRARAAELMMQPRGSSPHDDHFHIRIGCPPGMDKCIEYPAPRKRPSAVARAQPGSSEKGKGREKPRARATRPGHGGSSAPPPSPRPAPPPPKPVEPDDDMEEVEARRSEPIVPSLAPIVPGLDSVVIPAPLGGPRSGKADGSKPAPPDPAPIEDPDGVLDRR